MPDRKYKGFTIDCEEVQGEGAYAHFRRPTYGDIRRVNKEGDDTQDATARVIISLLDEWNWVDDEGNPIPLPLENPDALPYQEMQFLISEFNKMTSERAKN